MPKMQLADPTGGADNAPPDLLVGWEGGHQSKCPTPLSLNLEMHSLGLDLES